MRKTHKKGFSLVELMIGIGLTSLLLVSVNLLFFSGIRSSRKSSAIGEVDSEGRYVLGAIMQMVRYAKKIDACSSNSLTVRRVNNDSVTYSVSVVSGSEKISSSSADLTSSRVVISQCSGGTPFFNCPILGGTTDMVEVDICFQMQSRTALDVTDRAGEQGLEFKTKVTLENAGN